MKINEAFDWVVNCCPVEDCRAELWDLPNYVEDEFQDAIFEYKCTSCNTRLFCFFNSEAYKSFNDHQWSKEWSEHKPFFRLLIPPKRENDLTSEDKSGYIYMLRNQSYEDNLLKVGRTKKNPADRAKELSSSTGVPTPFEVVYAVKVNKAAEAENWIKEELKQYRLTDKREFYEISLSEAKNIMKKMASRWQATEEILINLPYWIVKEIKQRELLPLLEGIIEDLIIEKYDWKAHDITI